MQEIRILFRIDAPREAVFAAVSDHERFLSAAGTRTTVTRAGDPVRNGKGCLREVRARPMARFVEEVTSWDPPASFEYLIRECSLPLRHHGGRLAFEHDGSGTTVEWTTRFEVTVPVVGRLLEPLMKRILTRSFHGFLRAAKGSLEKEPRGPVEAVPG